MPAPLWKSTNRDADLHTGTDPVFDLKANAEDIELDRKQKAMKLYRQQYGDLIVVHTFRYKHEVC